MPRPLDNHRSLRREELAYMLQPSGFYVRNSHRPLFQENVCLSAVRKRLLYLQLSSEQFSNPVKIFSCIPYTQSLAEENVY